MIRGFALLVTLQAAGAWHATLLSRPSVARHAPLAMQLGMFGEKVQDGFRGDDKTRKEAEEALGVSISSDAALWEENDFAVYTGPAEWSQVSVDKVTLLTTYIALNFLAKLSVVMAAEGYTESAAAPWGKSPSNEWVVFGYVGPNTRVVKSKEGSSFGSWFLQTLLPDASPSKLSYSMRSQTGSGCELVFEKR